MGELDRRSYLVCATERSGSTLLCELLSATGVAGRPEEYFECLAATGRVRQPREYFEGVRDPTILELLPPLLDPFGQVDWDERLAGALERGTTPNGVFGSKMMWSYLADFLAHGEPEEQLGPLRWVHVNRGEVLSQAISLWRAVQTAEWRAGDRRGSRREPVFHAGAIAHLKKRIEEHERAWCEWFSARAIAPYRVTYEAFVQDPAATVRDVLSHVGVPPEGVEIPDPPLDRQSDRRSLEWAQRFRAEASV